MMSSKLRRLARRLCFPLIAGTIAAVGAAGPAGAHPHVWVSMHTKVLYENGLIVGLRHDWTFDQYYSEMAIEGLDKNKDGRYSREELAELAKINVQALKEFAYFTYPKLGEAKLEVGSPKDYFLEHKSVTVKSPGGAPSGIPGPAGAPTAAAKTGSETIAEAAAKPVPVLTLHFTLPLAKPVLAEAEGFTFSVGDPTFFIAFEPAAVDPVTLSDAAPKGCKAVRQDDDKDADLGTANPSKPGDLMAGQPSDLSISFVSAPVWKVICRKTG
jgi:ABC-type uncharacterized transport system substrate-binding protein